MQVLSWCSLMTCVHWYGCSAGRAVSLWVNQDSSLFKLIISFAAWIKVAKIYTGYISRGTERQRYWETDEHRSLYDFSLVSSYILTSCQPHGHFRTVEFQVLSYRLTQSSEKAWQMSPYDYKWFADDSSTGEKFIPQWHVGPTKTAWTKMGQRSIV